MDDLDDLPVAPGEEVRRTVRALVLQPRERTPVRRRIERRALLALVLAPSPRSHVIGGRSRRLADSTARAAGVCKAAEERRRDDPASERADGEPRPVEDGTPTCEHA